jgi:hypothetical protein
MRNKLIAIIASIFVLTTLSGCSNDNTILVNVENSEELSNVTFGSGNLILIPSTSIYSSCIYYDSSTRIVYWWNGTFSLDYATTPTPYYAPNGLPYRYNPETNTFEEINNIQ